MNPFKLLTYNIKEHNLILYTSFDPETNVPGFWRMLWKEVRSAFGLHGLWYIIKQICSPFNKQCPSLKPIVFAPLSNNNQRALEPIYAKLSADEYSILYELDEAYIPRRVVRFWSCIYALPLIMLYLKSSIIDRLRIRTYFDEFFNTIGYLKTLNLLLRYSDVHMIAMANDHCSFPRAILRVSQELDIKTMYIQHSSVTERFPALEFDYSLLDGEESFLKYNTVGKLQGSIYLTGSPRFDIISHYSKHEQKASGSIGIAINTMDNEDSIKSLCDSLLSSGIKDIIVRPHPAQTIDITWYLQKGIGFSDSKNENPFEFISHVDVVIAGECGIHLDAVLMGVRSICYNTIDADPLDWYSYIRNGLIPYAANMDELLSLLLNKNVDWQKSQQEKARWYNAAYGTKHEGHIGEMLADFIRFEQNGDIAGFDKKYYYIEKEIRGFQVKVYKNR